MADENKSETDAETEEEPTRKRGRSGDEDGLRADLAAERRARQKAQKDLETLEARLQEIEEGTKSDGEKLTDRVAKAEAAAAKATTEAAKLRVGIKEGLTLRQAMRLQGDTEEELLEDAKDLLETFGKKSDESKDSGEKSETDKAGKDDDADKGEKRPPSRRPTEDLSGGGDPTNPPEEMDPAKLAAYIPRP